MVYGLERLAATCSRFELVQNPEDLALLARLHVPADRLVLLGNGVDLERFRPRRSTDDIARARLSLGVGSSAVVVGTVGRLVWQKGFRELFAAAARLASSRPEVVFVVVGPEDAAKGDALTPGGPRRGVRRLGNVVFTGHRDDVEDLYAGFDVFVLPSYREGFPRSAMEAAACGLPVIATDIRGCREVVDHGVNGLLVPLHDVDALADALSGLAADPALRGTMGARARAKAEAEFDDRQVIRTTLDTYCAPTAGPTPRLAPPDLTRRRRVRGAGDGDPDSRPCRRCGGPRHPAGQSRHPGRTSSSLNRPVTRTWAASARRTTQRLVCRSRAHGGGEVPGGVGEEQVHLVLDPQALGAERGRHHGHPLGERLQHLEAGAAPEAERHRHQVGAGELVHDLGDGPDQGDAGGSSSAVQPRRRGAADQPDPDVGNQSAQPWGDLVDQEPRRIGVGRIAQRAGEEDGRRHTDRLPPYRLRRPAGSCSAPRPPGEPRRPGPGRHRARCTRRWRPPVHPADRWRRRHRRASSVE